MAVYQKEMKHAAAVLAYARKKKKPIIVYDTETEGFSAKEHRIIEISAVKLDPGTLSVLDSMTEYINPGRPLADRIVELTGITDDFLSDYMPEQYVFPKILAFFGNNPVVIGHNVSFDNRFLDAAYKRAGQTLTFAAENDPHLMCVIDTCQMARELLHKPTEIADHKLNTVAAYYGADAGLTWHEAGDDVTACCRIFKAMLHLDEKEGSEEISLETSQTEKGPEKMPDAVITSVGFFLGYRGHNRIYVHTDLGCIFYDGMDKVWDSREVDAQAINIDSIRRQMYGYYHVSDDDTLFKRLFTMHCKMMEDKVGRTVTFEKEEDAGRYAKKMQEKHFDIRIRTLPEKEGYRVELVKFLKSRKGKIVAGSSAGC